MSSEAVETNYIKRKIFFFKLLFFASKREVSLQICKVLLLSSSFKTNPGMWLAM
jgi:hypothetical protein